MENDLKFGKGIVFNPYLASDKHYYGSFFNLAENNIKSIFIEFKERLNVTNKITKPNEILNDYFNDNISIVDWERGIRILSDYFPIVNHLNLSIEEERFHKLETERRAYFRNNFIGLIDTIGKLRNYYTHYYHDPIVINEDVFKFLDESLFKTALDVKINYLKDDKTKEFLKETLKIELDKLVELKRKQFQEKKKNDPKVKIPNNDNLKDSIFNDAFKNLLFKKEISKTQKETPLPRESFRVVLSITRSTMSPNFVPETQQQSKSR